MKTFHLDIFTPEGVFYSGDCVSLIIPITDGMLGIMANRAPITASVTFGEAYYTKPDGEKILFSVSRGMVDVLNNTVKLLCDQALLPEQIDEDEERLKAQKARSEFLKKQSRKDYLLSKLMLANAVNNLRVKNKKT